MRGAYGCSYGPYRMLVGFGALDVRDHAPQFLKIHDPVPILVADGEGPADLREVLVGESEGHPTLNNTHLG